MYSINLSLGTRILNFFEKFIFALIMLFLVFIVVTNAGKWYLMLFPDIERVRIEGAFLHVDRLSIDKFISETLQQGFFDLDIQDLENELEQIEWIRDINIRRVWPGTLHIIIDEHQAIARWGQDALVNMDGEIFQPRRINSPTLPVFYTTSDRVPQLLDTYRHASRYLYPLNLAVRFIYEDQRHSLSLLIDNGFLLILGRTRHAERLQRFVQAYHSVVQDFSRHAVCVDLRYQYGFAVDPQVSHCDSPDISQTLNLS